MTIAEENQELKIVPTETLSGVVEYCETLKQENEELKKREAARAERQRRKRLDGTKRQDTIVWVNQQLKKHERLIALDRKRYRDWLSIKAKGGNPPPFEPLTRLKPIDIKVGRELCKSTRPQGDYAGPRQDTLARRLDVCEKTIQRSIARLKEEKIYFKERQRQKNNSSRLAHYHYIPWCFVEEKTTSPADSPADSESSPLLRDRSHIQETLSIGDPTQPTAGRQGGGPQEKETDSEGEIKDPPAQTGPFNSESVSGFREPPCLSACLRGQGRQVDVDYPPPNAWDGIRHETRTCPGCGRVERKLFFDGNLPAPACRPVRRQAGQTWQTGRVEGNSTRH